MTTSKAMLASAELELEQAGQRYFAARRAATPVVLERMGDRDVPYAEVQQMYDAAIPADIRARYEAALEAVDAAEVAVLAAKAADVHSEPSLRDEVRDQGDTLAVLIAVTMPGAKFTRDALGRIVSVTR